MRSAAATASGTVVTGAPADTGMPYAREELLALVLEEVHGGNRGRSGTPTQTGADRTISGGTPCAVPASRSDAQLLLVAAGAVIVAGLLVAVVLLLATGRAASPTKYVPFDAGVAGDDQAAS